MLIYEIVCKNRERHILFRTKDYLKAETFCDVYNKYHNGIFDEGAIINIIDTSKIESAADKFINNFKFMTEVDISDDKITAVKPVFVDDSRIKMNDAVNSLSEGTKLFFDITDDIDEEKIWAAYEVHSNA